MIVVNLLGAPCAGKSTLAALVFSKLKMLGVSCEIVTEFAKDLVWDNSLNSLNNQLYVFSEQFYRVWRLKNQVDVVVTDSPMVLSIYYNRKQNIENRLPSDLFDNLALYCHSQYKNLNFFINRDHDYVLVGRKHSEEESKQIELDMRNLYNDLNLNYIDISSSEESAGQIVEIILNALNKESKENDKK